jgi:hypothetical protein
VVADIIGHKPGKGWFDHFVKRNKARLQYCRTSALDPKHARCFNYTTVRAHFIRLKAIVDHYGIPWENVFNMDEKGCQIGGGRKGRRIKYLFGRNSRHRYRMRSANLELVTIVECVSAAGKAMKPYIIFKGQKINRNWATARGFARAQRSARLNRILANRD